MRQDSSYAGDKKGIVATRSSLTQRRSGPSFHLHDVRWLKRGLSCEKTFLSINTGASRKCNVSSEVKNYLGIIGKNTITSLKSRLD